MTPMQTLSRLAALAVMLCLSSGANAAPPDEAGIDAGIRRDLAEARREIRTDLARARAELDADNLVLGDGHGFTARRSTPRDAALPRAEITPAGDFLIAGAPVAIDADQRRQLLAYRSEILAVAHAGIDIGEASALAAIDAVDRGVWRMVLGAFTGSLERRVERTVRTTVEPAALQLCDRLPAVMAAQHQLAADLPAFGPYASLQPADITACRRDVRRQVAAR
ncbi:hypothetical protein [Luteimonas deserti]|uniref:DUF2884 family protein n=1 Tax=Luteimonas deserti TaxID=2752306 RepID=A0A7Z0QSL1_9GAMM|nr:hypothetical protein [Luteimonas deserti]NYZ64134.1 hypothetical protein [Luteimonas deserti]